jgi:hypothetical protein
VKSKLLITLLIIILLVVYYLFGMDYLEQRNQHESLNYQIAEVTSTLAQIPEPPHDLEPRLAAAQASLTAGQNAFPSKINSTRVINAILELADTCEVKAIPLVTRPWSKESIGEHDYPVFRVNMAIDGSFSRLVNFISKLENGELYTLIVEDLSITSVTEQSEGENVPEGTVHINASLDLAIYTQYSVSD